MKMEKNIKSTFEEYLNDNNLPSRFEGRVSGGTQKLVGTFTSEKISKYVFSNTGTTVIVDGEFENCLFILKDNIELNSSKLNKCSFILEGAQSIQLRSVEMENCKIINELDSLNIMASTVINLEFDMIVNQSSIKNKLDSLKIMASKLINLEFDRVVNKSLIKFVSIGGNSKVLDTNFNCKCEVLYIQDTEFENCEFDPYVSKKATLVETSFPNSIVTIDRWIETCSDRDTIYFNYSKKIIYKWKSLREAYSGLNLSLILILTGLFFIPYFIGVIKLLIVTFVFNNAFSPDFIPLWKAIFVKDQSEIMMFVNLFYLIYVVLRIFLTLQIARLTEGEKTLDGFGFPTSAPLFKDIDFYFKIHEWMEAVFYVVVVWSIFKIISILSIPVFSY
jgi:hypothetical protein